MNTILVPTDFSDDARNAALRAALLAREPGAARVVLLHVPPILPFDVELELRANAAAERALEALATELQAESGTAFEPRLAAGAVVPTIAGEAASCDLVVLGARGVNPLRDLAIGSSAERLLRKAPCPVLIVKAAPAGAYQRVLVPLDFSPDSGAALALAARIAPQAALTLVHAYDLPFEGKLGIAGASRDDIERYRSQVHERAGMQIDQAVTAAGLAPERTVRVVDRAYPPKLIQDSARALRAELIAIGKHGGSMLEDLLLGSVTLHTLAAAECDVLVVPSGR